MSNKANLIPGAHQLTPEEKSKGGINGAKSRRERKQITQLARDILDMPLHNDAVIDAEDLPSLAEVESANVDVKTRIIATLAIKALRGNVKATETLLTLSGDYVTRQEAIIATESTMYDPSKTEYIRNVNVMNGDNPEPPEILNPGEVRYYDFDGNLVKVIYGEEAERLIHLHLQETKEKGIPMNFEIEIVDIE